MIKDVEKHLVITCSIANKKNPYTYNLEELIQLAKTAGLKVVHSFHQNREFSHPKTYVGKGKLEEIKNYITEHNIELFLADDELSPLQYRLLGLELGIKILDRTSLVLEIFSQRAKTHEAKLQIELAQLAYLKPRLTRLWTHLSRLGGGIGTKGPGETQLEVDKRLISKRMSVLKKGIQKVQKNRLLYQNNRQKNKILRAALIGYTNSGKSTLLNTLTGSSVLSENKLFATLDPTTRKFWVKNGLEILITDTVGFINKLPHQLVDAFKSTLEEAIHADFFLHVLDASSPYFEKHLAVAEQIIRELSLDEKPSLLLLNKIDKLENLNPINHFIKYSNEVCFISAVDPKHSSLLRKRIDQFIQDHFKDQQSDSDIDAARLFM